MTEQLSIEHKIGSCLILGEERDQQGVLSGTPHFLTYYSDIIINSTILTHKNTLFWMIDDMVILVITYNLQAKKKFEEEVGSDFS